MRPTMLTAAALGLILLGPPALAQTDQDTDQESDQPAASEAAEQAADYGLDTPLAEVDGTALTLGEMISIRRELPEQYQSVPDEVLFEGILEQMIDQYLLAEAARASGIDEDPAVEITLRNQRRAILADAYLRRELERLATEERVEELYRERYVEGEPEAEIKAAHILVETEERAKELKAELDAGADFAELAQEHGTDATRNRGGDLGWFAKTDMVPGFAEAAFAIEPGSVSDPVQTQFGWHLIKVEDRRQRTPPELAEVRDDLMQEVIRNAQSTVVEELRAAASVEKPEPAVPPGAIRADDLLRPEQAAE